MEEQELVADPSNAAQAELWRGKDADIWVAEVGRQDRAIARHYGPFLAAAAVGADDRVLDVGCGNGISTRDAARLATRGSVLGVDLSPQMLALARRIAADEGLGNVEFRLADVQIYPFEDGAFDLVISRMGSMFFGDPHAAFTNLARALRPGGRMTLLTWQPLADNEWLSAYRTAMAVGRYLPTPPPDSPNPFTLSEPARVRALLEGAGFTDVTLEPVTQPLWIGTDVDDAFQYVSRFFGWLLDGLDETGREAGLAALRQSIADHQADDGIEYRSATWIIQAVTPGG
jgi:SAM-dependent methyltransferase